MSYTCHIDIVLCIWLPESTKWDQTLTQEIETCSMLRVCDACLWQRKEVRSSQINIADAEYIVYRVKHLDLQILCNSDYSKAGYGRFIYLFPISWSNKKDGLPHPHMQCVWRNPPYCAIVFWQWGTHMRSEYIDQRPAANWPIGCKPLIEKKKNVFQPSSLAEVDH